MAYLACDPNKLVRAMKAVMVQAREGNKDCHIGDKIVGIGYDGRKDPHTRAMGPDNFGKLRTRIIKKEHIAVSEEPTGRYLSHFVPDEPICPQKPALKVAQALYELLDQNDPLQSLLVLAGDSTNSNTGWKGGTHAHLEKLLDRKLFWGICILQHSQIKRLKDMLQASPGCDGWCLSTRAAVDAVRASLPCQVAHY
eukprot:GHVU01215117.1.p1 GENE.GHVU01215117.1~~GHVU01215117.1.p1  ORF type:complete len:196 (+),score=11.90 GHVU01215117.1:215-802(+)